MKKQSKWLEEYRNFIEGWYREVINNEYFEGDEHADKVMLTGDIEDFRYFHYGLTAKETAEIDAKYLPAIYEVIKARFPNMTDWFIDIIKGLKIKVAISGNQKFKLDKE